MVRLDYLCELHVRMGWGSLSSSIAVVVVDNAVKEKGKVSVGWLVEEMDGSVYISSSSRLLAGWLS